MAELTPFLRGLEGCDFLSVLGGVDAFFNLLVNIGMLEMALVQVQVELS